MNPDMRSSILDMMHHATRHVAWSAQLVAALVLVGGMRAQAGSTIALSSSGSVTAENFQASPANPLYSFKVTDGKVKLSCANGMQIIFR